MCVLRAMMEENTNAAILAMSQCYKDLRPLSKDLCLRTKKTEKFIERNDFHFFLHPNKARRSHEFKRFLFLMKGNKYWSQPP